MKYLFEDALHHEKGFREGENPYRKSLNFLFFGVMPKTEEKQTYVNIFSKFHSITDRADYLNFFKRYIITSMCGFK